jgi:predicted CXXCH cytochrome family protein
MNVLRPLSVGLLVAAAMALSACGEQPGPVTGGTPMRDQAEATFVGSDECAACHDRIYSGWLTTQHSVVMQEVEANPRAIKGDFVSPSAIRTFDLEADIIITHGIQWKQRYIDSEWRVLPAQWNFDSQTWSPYQADTWMERDWRPLCAYCHVVGFDTETLEWSELSVGCEACHGPGSAHVDEPRIGNIINPARLTPTLAGDICTNCHTRGKSPDGEWDFPIGYNVGDALGPQHFTPVPKDNESAWWPDGATKMHRQQGIEWKESKHFIAGVNCVTCHTVHSSSTAISLRETLPNNLCVSCHSEISTDPVTGHAPIAGAPQHSNCVACHMPPTGTSADFGDERSHRMWVIKPQVTIDLGGGDPEAQPNSCSFCHPDIDPAVLQEALDGGLAALKQ